MSTSTERMRALRARRAAGLLPAEGQGPRDVDDLLGPAVAETLAALKLTERDAGAAQLARRYAAVMDAASDPAWAARWVGPLLLRALAELGATPAARKGIREPSGPRRPNQLDRLRAAHLQHPATRARRGGG